MIVSDSKDGPRSASVTDVARLAGVSPQTVSRVNNNRANVLPETRERVLNAMLDLGYKPNTAARALRYGRLKTIGVIVFDLSNYGNTRTLEAILQAATKEGYSLTIFPVIELTSAGLANAFDQLKEAVVDGVILIADAQLLDRAQIDPPEKGPVVVANTVPTGRYAVVDTDQAAGATMATEHLLGLGHKTVHIIEGPIFAHSSNSRKAAWRAALKKAGREIPQTFLGNWSTHSGYLAGLEIIKDPTITAVFALNDQMALGAMRAFHEQGIRVPEDISVVGFDDIEEAHSFWPPLTTVRQDFTGMGNTTIEVLLQEIGTQQNSKGTNLVTPELILRNSTAVPPK